MDLLSVVFDKYGLRAAVALFIAKTIWDMVLGSTRKYIKAIEDNTGAVDKLRKDLQIAFHNIRLLNNGKIDMPSDEKQGPQ